MELLFQPMHLALEELLRHFVRCHLVMRAPKGYRKLLGNVRFEISKDSKDKVIIVKNDKDKPGRLRPRLPNTGTVTVLLTLAAGLVLLMIGRRLLRDEGKK